MPDFAHLFSVTAVKKNIETGPDCIKVKYRLSGFIDYSQIVGFFSLPGNVRTHFMILMMWTISL